MKKSLLVILVIFLSQALIAQVPNDFNYQGVARNAQGQALVNQPIKVRASLIKQGPSGTLTTYYTETRSLTTNVVGLFSFKINSPGASAGTGSIGAGDWLNPDNTQLLKIELDVNNTGTWTDMGTQAISSVPYAMYAANAWYANDLTTPSIGFSATSNTAQQIANNGTARITFEATETGSSGFSIDNDEFIASNYGLFHFDGTILTGLGVANVDGDFYVKISVNNTIRHSFRFEYNSGELRKSNAFSAILHLATGDKVSLSVQNMTGATLTVGAESTIFNGHNLR